MNQINSSKIRIVSIGKLTLSFIALFALLFIFMIVTSKVKASTLTDLQKKQQDLSQQIANNSKIAQQKQQEASTLQGSLRQITSEIFEIQAKLQETQDNMDQTQKDIDDLAGQIKTKEREIEVQKANQGEALRTIYEHSQVENWEIILGANSFSEIINRDEYLETVEQKIESTLAAIRELKGQLEAKKADFEKKKKDLDDLRSQQEAYQAGLSYQQDQKSRLYQNAKTQQRTLEAQVAEAKRMSSQVEAEINRIVASMNSGSGNIIAKDRGTSAVGLQWPMNFMYISCYYGESTPFQSFHSGIDLVNIMGTPVYAAGSGTVTVTTSMQSNGSYYGYGYYIVIGHNARFSTLYGHLTSFAVAAGQEVSQGQIIGYEGTTGWSTGPHLHFEVWEYGARRNPLNYLP